MSRYIDADALAIDYYDDYETKDDEYTYAYVSKAQIDSAPSIDIVRCGECEYWRAYETWSECGLWAGDPYETAKTNADDFCSYGSRSEKPNNSERSSE